MEYANGPSIRVRKNWENDRVFHKGITGVVEIVCKDRQFGALERHFTQARRRSKVPRTL
jgi:hypothetical protein